MIALSPFILLTMQLSGHDTFGSYWTFLGRMIRCQGCQAFVHDNLLLKVARFTDVDMERYDTEICCQVFQAIGCPDVKKAVAMEARLWDVLTSNNQLPGRPGCGMS